MVLEDYLPIGVEHEWTCAIYRSRGKSYGYMEHEGQSFERVVEDVLCAPMASGGRRIESWENVQS
jgi:hypothetical protein